MKCEKCGAEINSLLVNMFDIDGADKYVVCHIYEPEGYDAIEVETDQNWTGYGQEGEDMRDSIACPFCRKYPFEDEEIQVYDVVKVVMFKRPC